MCDELQVLATMVTLETLMRGVQSAVGLGVEANDLTVLQVALRAVIIFFASLCIARVADKRFFAKKTAFDLILSLIIASMMARAINGSEQLLPTIVAGFVVAYLHRILGWAACRWRWVDDAIKGHSQDLVVNGRVDAERMRHHRMTQEDLCEVLRLEGVEHPSDVRLARLERSGEVSVIKADDR